MSGRAEGIGEGKGEGRAEGGWREGGQGRRGLRRRQRTMGHVGRSSKKHETGSLGGGQVVRGQGNV
eukprot:11167465-Lingulodinium_polyedra.AAC.1